jgi:hypothetical protein
MRPMDQNRELSTSEVAKEIGVPTDLLRKWKYRGILKLAPQGISGQGRSVECYWSHEAVEEARAWANSPRLTGRNRTRGVDGQYEEGTKK